MFYTWAALSADVNDPMVAAGIMSAPGEQLPQKTAAAFLADERAFLARVAECWPLGRAWLGRRNRSGQISWTEQAGDWPGAAVN